MIERMNKNLREPDVFENGEIVYIQDENRKWTIWATVLNRRKHQGINSALYMLKKAKTKRITCRNERAIRRFPGDSPDNRTDSTADNQTSGEGPVVNAVTASRLHTGIPAIRKDNIIHPARLSDIGRAVTEQEAMEIEKEHTTQSASGAEQKRSISFSKVCEVIIPGVERDELRHHLFHFYQNRPKDVPPSSNGTDVDQDKKEDEQRSW